MRRKNHYTLAKAILLIFITLTEAAATVYGQAPVANFSASPVAGCSPLVVNFQDNSTGSPTSWSWDFGNGNTSTAQNPTVSYFIPGAYTVSLTATNASGSNTITRTAYINVYEPPTVNFSASNTVGCFPMPVQFTDLSTAGAGNTNTIWSWDFGNGQTSTQQNPLATYTSSGNYTVTLRVTNDKGCTRIVSRPNFISVNTGVDAVFSNTQATVCRAPATISFTNSSTGPGVLSYQWLFGDGNTSVLQNPVHSYATGGNYTVTLIVSSSSGCVDTVLSASPVVIGGITTSFNSPANVCVNAPANFTLTSLPSPGTISWNFGDGNTSTQAFPTHVYTTPGVYTIWMYNSFSNCNDSASATITVNPRPVADFTSPDTIKCEPSLTSSFQNISTGAVSWQWDFGDGGTSTLQNPTHTYTNYGNYSVTLIATNAFGCTDTIVKTDFIKIRRATISIPSLPDRGCIPFLIMPVATITSLDAVTSYLWNFGDGNTSTSATPTHTYTAQGVYPVFLVITTASGCTDTLTIPQAIRVGTKPVADFSASPLTQCAYQDVQFTDLSTPLVDEWYWSFGDGGTSILQNPSYAYLIPGPYNVTLIATNSGCPDTISRASYITVMPPVARFNFSANCSVRTEFQFTDQSITDPVITPLSWHWDFGDGNTSNIQSPVHNFPALGVYNVTLTVTNGSCSHSITQTVHAIDTNPDLLADQTTACKPALINFTATNISIPDIASYYWDFGDGQQQSVTGVTISHTYTASGNYSVMLVTTDINGCRDTVARTNYIRVNGPIAVFTANNVAGCIGLTTIFNDLSTNDGVNAIVDWQWDFGDGTIQNFTAPPFSHTYNTQGVYSVKLKVTDATGCTDSLILPNLVAATDPAADFISPDTLTCPLSTVNFHNTSAIAYSITTSTWDFGDGNSTSVAGSTSVTNAYAVTGTYDVKLVITDIYGCSDSITKNIYIRVDEPVAALTVSDSISSCSPMEVQFTNQSTYYTSSFWDFGAAGTSTLNSPTHYFSTPGVYNVKLVVTSPGGCKDSVYQTITLYDTIGASLTYIPLNGCKPLSATFNAFSPGPMVNYIWDLGDGTSQTTTTPSINHVYTSFGNFVPNLIMEDPTGCYILVTGIDTVRVIGLTADFGLDKNVLCDAGVINFTDSTTFNDPITNFSWNFGDGGTSSQQHPAYQYTAPGIYNVSLAVQSLSGCRDTVWLTNAVTVVQRPLIDIVGDTAVCLNQSLLHSGVFIQPDTSIVTWMWNFPNGNSSSLQNPVSQTYTTAGNFLVRAIATNSSGCKDTTTQNILVHALPTVTMPGTMTIQNGFPVTIPATYSSGVQSWAWTPATGLSCTNCATPDAGPSFNTAYRVTFTDSNSCRNFGDIYVVVICKNTNLFIPNTFSPNGDGSNDVFYPRGTGLSRVKSLRIFNRWGEIVFEKQDFPVNNAAAGWNGFYKGRKPQADVYIFQAEIFCENGEIITLNGNISLIL